MFPHRWLASFFFFFFFRSSKPVSLIHKRNVFQRSILESENILKSCGCNHDHNISLTFKRFVLPWSWSLQEIDLKKENNSLNQCCGGWDILTFRDQKTSSTHSHSQLIKYSSLVSGLKPQTMMPYVWRAPWSRSHYSFKQHLVWLSRQKFKYYDFSTVIIVVKWLWSD